MGGGELAVVSENATKAKVNGGRFQDLVLREGFSASGQEERSMPLRPLINGGFWECLNF
jgi:hypothetical protein